MSQPEPTEMSDEEILKYLGLLNDRLRAENATGELAVVGGTAMVLAFKSRKSTKDIDALFHPASVIRRMANEIAQEHELHPGWLNDGAKGFLSPQGTHQELPLDFSNLRLLAPSAEYMLAMKCMSARVGVEQKDKDDAKFLIERLGLNSTEQVEEIIGRYYPAKLIQPKTTYFVREIIDELP